MRGIHGPATVTSAQGHKARWTKILCCFLKFCRYYNSVEAYVNAMETHNNPMLGRALARVGPVLGNVRNRSNAFQCLPFFRRREFEMIFSFLDSNNYRVCLFI